MNGNVLVTPQKPKTYFTNLLQYLLTPQNVSLLLYVTVAHYEKAGALLSKISSKQSKRKQK